MLNINLCFPYDKRVKKMCPEHMSPPLDKVIKSFCVVICKDKASKRYPHIYSHPQTFV